MKNRTKSALCALLLIGSYIAGSKAGEKNDTEDIREEYTVVSTATPRITTGNTNNVKVENINYESAYKELANRFYREVNNKVNLTEHDALGIVELLNGEYPVILSNLDKESANAKINELVNKLAEIIRYNLNSSTSNESMINLSNYVSKGVDKEYLTTAMSLAKPFVSEISKEGRIGEVKWESGAKYYNSAVDLINYEFNATNDAEFLQMYAGTRLALQTIFNEANKYMPDEAHVHRDASEPTVREFELYWKYFVNDLDKKAYIPRRTSDNKIIYVYTNEYCYDEEIYTKEEMYALAGISSLQEQKRIGIDAKLWIWQLGVQTEIDNRIEDAIAEMHAMTDAKVLKK